MLSEIFIWTTAQAARGARTVGLVKEVTGIISRYKRQKKSWLPHLEATKQTIENALAPLSDESRILILGSGLCYDIPLQALSRFSYVRMIDAVDTRVAKRRRKPFPNIEFVLKDITGFIEPYLTTPEDAAIIIPTPSVETKGFDLIVSCNLLSQLPLPFTDTPPSNENEKTLSSELQLKHINMLENAPCEALLISDYARTNTSNASKTIYETIAPKTMLPEPTQTWDWCLAPIGEGSKSTATTLHVGVWKFY